MHGNTIDSNAMNGVSAATGATGNHIDGNAALGNGFFDLADSNPGCDRNNWFGNHFLTANQSCIH